MITLVHRLESLSNERWLLICTASQTLHISNNLISCLVYSYQLRNALQMWLCKTLWLEWWWQILTISYLSSSFGGSLKEFCDGFCLVRLPSPPLSWSAPISIAALLRLVAKPFRLFHLQKGDKFGRLQNIPTRQIRHNIQELTALLKCKLYLDELAIGAEGFVNMISTLGIRTWSAFPFAVLSAFEFLTQSSFTWDFQGSIFLPMNAAQGSYPLTWRFRMYLWWSDTTILLGYLLPRCYLI